MDWKAKLLLALAGSWAGIRQNILVPLLGRIGTAMTAYLVASVGAPEELSQQVAVGVVAAGLIIYDLMVDWMNRKSAVRKAGR